MTGCPNGCARPYNADIGLVGRSAHIISDGTPGPGTYTIFLGGRTVGDRLNVEFKDYVPYDQVVAGARGRLRPIQGRHGCRTNRSAISATELEWQSSPAQNRPSSTRHASRLAVPAGSMLMEIATTFKDS